MRVGVSVGAIAGLWLVSLVVVWSGAVFFVGTWLGMVVSAVCWTVVIVAVALLGVASGRRWILAGSSVVTLVLAAATYNWSALAPRAWFEVHRPLYERVVSTTDTDDSYYGVSLPFLLRPLSADGRMSEEDGQLFLPQWLGVPDDAGGYVWSPERPPSRDLYGTWCVDRTDLGGGWWSCGM